MIPRTLPELEAELRRRAVEHDEIVDLAAHLKEPDIQVRQTYFRRAFQVAADLVRDAAKEE